MQSLTDARYSTIADFLDAANNELVSPQNKQYRDNYLHHEDRGSWYGAKCKTGADVQKLLRDGWADGRAKYETMRDRIDTSNLIPVDRRRRLTRTDMGDDVDMQAIYRGDLDRAWTVARRTRVTGPQQITILANMVCSGVDDADTLFWRGVAAVALADRLESAGYNIRLVVGFGGENDDGIKTSCRITVKDFGMPLDISSVTSVIMPGFFRAIGHGWLAGHQKGRWCGGGIAVKQCIADKGEIVLSHAVNSRDSAVKWAKETIESLNNWEAA